MPTTYFDLVAMRLGYAVMVLGGILFVTGLIGVTINLVAEDWLLWGRKLLHATALNWKTLKRTKFYGKDSLPRPFSFGLASTVLGGAKGDADTRSNKAMQDAMHSPMPSTAQNISALKNESSSS